MGAVVRCDACRRGLFDASASGTAYFPWRHWRVVAQACPNLTFLTDADIAAGRRAETVFLWGAEPGDRRAKALDVARRCDARIVHCEDGFLRSADTWADAAAPHRYRRGVSVVFDTSAPYYDAESETNIERLLNDPDFVVTDDERREAHRLMTRIVAEKVTKYNHQPMEKISVGRPGRRKVLVVDQSYGDFSIRRGRADDSTFVRMLDDAVRENPDADVFVKTHPDTMAGERKGYYGGVAERDGLYRVTRPINPYSLLDEVDKVYVCSTQFGFEALMAGKEVHVYGLPFYAGWGVTLDRQTNARRVRRRTLEELFYAFYCVYTHWVDPTTGRPCDIDTAIDRLLALRREYAFARRFFFLRRFARRLLGRGARGATAD